MSFSTSHRAFFGRTGTPARGLLLIAALFLAMLRISMPAAALQPIEVEPEQARLEITTVGELYDSRGDSIQIETAAGSDGVTARMTVRASTPGANPNWLVFALTNKTDKSVERWLTADRYTVIGSGVIWPDLDARRIESVTPSVGFVPERIKSDRADIFRITLEPGQTITYVAEITTERVARIYLWQPLDYEVKTRDRQLFNGAMLGLTGLLAIFLTSIFAANHKIIFPAAALVSWCVLSYLSVDFGFFHKLFALKPEENAVYRAAGEASIAASLLMFMTAFLRLTLLPGIVRMLLAVWMIAQLALIAIAVIDPRLAATFARLSFISIGGVGAIATLYLAIRGQDRALSLIPTWILFLVWIFAAGLTLVGRLSGDVVISGLVAGLVLIVVLIGFTVTQFAFKSLEPSYGGTSSELESRALAIDSSGAAVWEWNIRRDEIKVGPAIENALGLMSGELSAKVDDFTKHVHQTDRERFRLVLLSVQERAGARIKSQFRMRHADNNYRWLELEAASVPNADGRTLRCIGLMRDVTDVKRAHERLLHDAVHDSLTGLPNRELFLDRLRGAIVRAKAEKGIRPTIIFIDLDKFRSINSSFGLVRADSLLLTVARRLQRHLSAGDTLARVGGDQFALLYVAEQDPKEFFALSERVRRSLRSPIPLAGQEVVLTGSIGIAIWDGDQADSEDLLKEAELAMYRAKRGGPDRIEVFQPEMRRDRDDRIEIESELRKALEKGQIKAFYQPIFYLPTEELAGFEALVRWDHPKRGLLSPSAFVPVAEESDLILKLGAYVLQRASQEAARWQKELPRPDRPLFVSVNISSRQLFRPEHIQELKHIISKTDVPRGVLRLEVTETLVMENPEQAAEILELLRGAGAELALDDFGTGYSSLAYLHRFCFDTIKIDKELVAASSSASGATIMRSMVALAHELGKRVVAEGVEHEDESNFLRSIGCEYGQGYFYGEPISERDVLALLRMVRKSESKLAPRGLFKPKTQKKKSSQTSKDISKDQGATPLAAQTNGANGASAQQAALAPPSQPEMRTEGRGVDRAAPSPPGMSGQGKNGPHSNQGNRPMPPPPLPAAFEAAMAAPLPPYQPQAAPQYIGTPQTRAPSFTPPAAAYAPPPMPLPVPSHLAQPSEGLPEFSLDDAIMQPLAAALARVPVEPPVDTSSVRSLAAMPMADSQAPIFTNGVNGHGAQHPQDAPLQNEPMHPEQMRNAPQPQRADAARAPQSMPPDLSHLPPGVAASIARLAGILPSTGEDAPRDQVVTAPVVSLPAGATKR